MSALSLFYKFVQQYKERQYCTKHYKIQTMKKRITNILVLCVLLSLTSCYTTKIYNGEISKTEPMVKVNKEWNHHIIGGLVPLGAKMKADDYVGGRKNYMVKTNQSFLNLLVNYLTLGLYTPTTTTFYVPLNDISKK